MNCFCHAFWHFSNQKKLSKKQLYLEHTLVNNNKESIIESQIMKLS